MNPPNGQGIAALQILNVLENYDIKKLGFNSAEYIHLFTEAKKKKTELNITQMSFAKVPVDYLISKEYARKRNNLISFDKVLKSVDSNNLEDGDTIYLTVAINLGIWFHLFKVTIGHGISVIPNILIYASR